MHFLFKQLSKAYILSFWKGVVILKRTIAAVLKIKSLVKEKLFQNLNCAVKLLEVVDLQWLHGWQKQAFKQFPK